MTGKRASGESGAWESATIRPRSKRRPLIKTHHNRGATKWRQIPRPDWRVNHPLFPGSVLEAPEVDAVFSQNEVFGFVESVKSVSDLYVPVGGKVIGVNHDLADAPELVNKAPYENGWMIEVMPDCALVWEYISPYFHTEGKSNHVYRAYRVPYQWARQLDLPRRRRFSPSRRANFGSPAQCTSPKKASPKWRAPKASALCPSCVLWICKTRKIRS